VLLVIVEDLFSGVFEICSGLPRGISVPLIPWAVEYSLVLVVVSMDAAVNSFTHVPFLLAFRITGIGDNDSGFGVGYLAGEGIVWGEM
jgi:hypothetical protein